MAESRSAGARFGRWLGSAFEKLRWCLAGTYLIGTCAFMAFLAVESRGPSKSLVGVGLLDLGSMTCQGLLVLGSGLRRLDSPLPARRLWMPVLATAVTPSFTAMGLGLGLLELLPYGGGSEELALPFWTVLGVFFVAACVGLWLVGRDWSRFRVLWRFSLLVLGVAGVEIAACVGLFMVTVRRDAFFSGLLAALGIGMGVVTLHFALGPLIVALFLRRGLRQERFEASLLAGEVTER